jgi:hypothetical protein
MTRLRIHGSLFVGALYSIEREIFKSIPTANRSDMREDPP